MRTSGTGTCADFSGRLFGEQEARLSASTAGFTLIELVIVLLIVSAVALLAWPSISALADGTLKSEGKRLASVVRFVADEAASRRRVVPMTVDLGQRSVAFDAGDGVRTEHFPSLNSFDAASAAAFDGRAVVTLKFGPEGAGTGLVFHLRDGAKALDVVYNDPGGRVALVEP